MGLIADTLVLHLPHKRKKTVSGWISFNAPCCQDKRGRGGFIVNGGDAVSYHCFNCGFKASWQPGRTLSQKMRKLMRLLNVSDDVISKLSLEALKTHEEYEKTSRSIIPTFDERALPMGSEPIDSLIDKCPEKLLPVLEYMAQRHLTLEDYKFYWTNETGFRNRLIIPFYDNNKIVGYTARAVNDVKPKYISEQQPGYVFNIDGQPHDRKFVIVNEGPLDAISIGGVALLGAEIRPSQDWLLRRLNREIILVPDRDHEGPKTVEQAIELGWSVSMPDWPEGVKDVNDAVVKLGRLATLWLIINAKESSSLKIQLKAKRWFND